MVCLLRDGARAYGDMCETPPRIALVPSASTKTGGVSLCPGFRHDTGHNRIAGLPVLTVQSADTNQRQRNGFPRAQRLGYDLFPEHGRTKDGRSRSGKYIETMVGGHHMHPPSRRDEAVSRRYS